ncbi:LPS export ABC transporter permease LptG [Arboricoccus pini]|uniref:LPS export ABC transporter permease LptG n=1 Tax=Arboricoccus pini TaxID=1963835 RepID=A0A212QMX1_9PROT|nr:LptF/LptG family permease [Arboricoccus pini]SNB60656.1 LPS export ABC transporter permease LptG [Arboricoccus pini]
MSRLTYYLNRKFLLRFVIILVTVAGFASLFDLLETGSRVLRRAAAIEGMGDSVGWRTLVWYAGIRLPTLITDLLPLMALVAALVTINDILRHRELVIIWTSGVSRAGLVLRMLPVALLLFAGKFALDDWAIPASAPTLDALGLADFGRVAGPSSDWLWVRDGENVVRIPATSRPGKEMNNVIIFRRDNLGRTTEVLRAARVRANRSDWHLEDVLLQPASAKPVTRIAQMTLPINVRLDKVEVMTKAPRELSFLDLWDAVNHNGYGLGSVEAQRTWLHGRLAAGVTMMFMVGIGMAIVRRFNRTSMVFRIFTEGLAIGFLSMIVSGTLLAFGEVGLISPIFSAWAVPAVLALILLRWMGLLELPRRQRRGDDFHGRFRVADAEGATKTGAAMPFGSHRAERS